jgi:type I restriction enzyme S subunit
LREGWIAGTVSDFVEVNPREVALPAEAPFVPMEAVEPGARWGEATQRRENRGGARFRGGDVLFARITPCLENGKVAQWPFGAGRAGGSTEFIVLRATADIDPSFLYYWATSREVREAATALLVGSTGRQRLAPDDLAAMPISLPSIEEQRRVAALLESIDAVAAESLDRSSAALALKARFLGAAVDGLRDTDCKPLGSLADVQSGVSWTKADELPEGDPAGIGVMGVKNVQRDHVHARDCGWIRKTPQAEQRAIARHTILTIRTNGNPDRIGNVHLAPIEAVGYTISSFLTAITPHEPDEAGYVLRVLQSPQVQNAITAATSGSTGLKNIAVTWIRELEIPWPSLRQRRDLDATAVAFDSLATAHASEATILRTLRDALLTALLSGAHTIPESYDRFLSEHRVSLELLDIAAV